MNPTMFGSYHLRVTIGSVLALVLLATPALAADPQPPKWGASIDFEGKLGTERHLGEADLFVPLAQDDRTLFFGNARFRIDDSDSKEGNFGLGLRHMHASGWNGGVYGYFDRRETTHDNDFNQLTFGAEALGMDFDLRANSYWPIGDTTKNADALSTASLSGTSVIFRGGEERAFRGFDAEAGWRVPVFQFDSPYDFRVYGGGFHFYDPDDVAPDVTGPRLRAEFTSYEVPYLTKDTRVTLGAEWQNDDVRGSQAFGSLRLRIPLQSGAQRNRFLTAQERRMTTPVVRDIDIVAQAGAYGAPETATLAANGQTLVVVNADTNADGSLTNELTAAGANSTVILSGTINATATSTLQAGQTLTAGSATIRSPSGRIATLQTTGTITGGFAGEIITMANNSTLSGLTVTNTLTGGGGAIGVSVNNATGATIANNTITVFAQNQEAFGVNITGNTTITVSGNTVTATSATNDGIALVLSGAGVTATVAKNTLSASGGVGGAVGLQNVTINTATSTGNVIVTGACTNLGGVTGSVSFTDGSVC
jgi:hypothetical protein